MSPGAEHLQSSAAGPGPVCVVGCPRSGTYLLSMMLSHVFGVAFPVETHFVPLFRRRLSAFGDLAHVQNRELLLRCIFDFLSIWTPRSERDRDPAIIRYNSLLAAEESTDTILAQSVDFDGLVDALFRAYARVHNSQVYGEKSAYFRHWPLEQSLPDPQRSRVIHVIRDGRDVALSWMGIWTGPVTLGQAARTWSEHVQAKRAWGAVHPDRYFELRYEDLVRAPDTVMQDLARFLGAETVAPVETFHRSALATTLASGAPHAKLAEPVDHSNVGRWQQAMPAEGQRLFEHCAGATLTELGYSRRYTNTGSAHHSPVLMLRAAAQSIRGRMSGHELQIQSKTQLPMCILACRRLGVSPLRLLNQKHPTFLSHQLG